jgi:hypothetical protein
MKRALLTATLIVSALAFADAKDDAQSCTTAKKNVTEQKQLCADELAKLEKVDCQSDAQRKAIDFVKVSAECTRKLKDTSKGSKVGSHCKVVDDSGAIVAELDSEGTSLKCNTELRAKVKREQCEPGKKLEYQFIGEALGKETRPTAFTVTCPGK